MKIKECTRKNLEQQIPKVNHHIGKVVRNADIDMRKTRRHDPESKVTNRGPTIRNKKGRRTLGEECGAKMDQIGTKIRKRPYMVQWNMQGMGSSKEDVIKLLEIYQPVIFAGQETWYGEEFIDKYNGYEAIVKQGHYNRRYHGGVVLYIDFTCPFTKVE